MKSNPPTMAFRHGRLCVLLLCNLLLFFAKVPAQLCSTPGQNPLTPFPVCGNTIFSQSSVPACGGLSMVTRCTGDGVPYMDVNPYYYQITCYQSGTLSFTITPHLLSDDYDWQLFDITGKDPMLIYTDPSLIVASNWSGSSGVTGTSTSAVNAHECASNPFYQNVSTFSKMPNLIQGHIYLLMVSHYTSYNQSGYDLNLSAPGGTAVITDPLIPAIAKATVVCSNKQIGLKFNKPIQCNTIAANGSDFIVSGTTPITIVAAAGYKCSGDFDTDSVTLQFTGNLTTGTYSIRTKNGTDGNAILDFCLNSMNASGAVAIQYTPVVQIQSFSATTCSGANFSIEPFSGAGNIVPSGTVYTWPTPTAVNITGAQSQTIPITAISGKLFVTGSTVQSATYWVTPSGAGCTGQPFSCTIFVQPVSNLTAASISSCSAAPFVFTPVNGINGLLLPGTILQYTPVTIPVTVSGAQPGMGTSVQGVIRNFTQTIQSVIYQVIPVSGACSGQPFSLTAQVFPVPEIQALSTTICDGISFTITPTIGIIPATTFYSWPAPSMPSGVGGGVALSGASMLTGKLTSASLQTQTVTYQVTPSTANCKGNLFSLTVFLKPSASIQAISLSICSGNNFLFSPVSVLSNRVPAITVYNWDIPLAPGITGGNAAVAFTECKGTLTNTTSSIKTATYQVIPVTDGCLGNTFTLVVQVKPIAIVQSIPCTVCTQNLLTIQPTDGVNGIIPAETQFTWVEKDSVNAITGLPLIKISKIITTRFANPLSTAAATSLSVTPVTGCGEGKAFSLVTSVLPKPMIQSLKDTICSGELFQIVLQDQLNGTIPNQTSYAWTSTVSSGWSGSLTGTSSNGTIPLQISNMGTIVQELPLQVTPAAPGACMGNPFTITLRVQTVAKITAITTTLCSGVSFSYTPVSGVNGFIPDATFYNWQPLPTSSLVTGALFTNFVNYLSGSFTSSALSPVAVPFMVTPITIKDGLSCAGLAFTYTAFVQPLPTATIQSNGPSVICEGKEAILQAAESGTYLWSNGSTLPSVSITQPQTITLQVTNNYGCSRVSAPFAVTVHPRPRARFDLPEICLPNGIGTFINRSIIADGTESQFSFVWIMKDNNNIITSTLASPQFRFTSTGSYPIQLMVFSGKGCVDTLMQNFSAIYPQPKIVTTASDIQNCIGNPIQFFATGNGMGFTPKQWTWILGSSGISQLQNPVWKFQQPGIQQVKAFFVNQKGCVSDTALMNIPVYPMPQLQLTNYVSVMQGDSIQLVPRWVSGQNLYFKWIPSQFLNSDTIQSPVAKPLEDIRYQLQVTGDGYCMVADTVHVKVLRTPEIPNVFSPNGDGIYDTWQIRYLQDYPNATVQIFNRTGRIVYTSTGNGRPWDGTFEGKPVPVATYYYVIKLNNGKSPLAGSVTVIR